MIFNTNFLKSVITFNFYDMLLMSIYFDQYFDRRFIR